MHNIYRFLVLTFILLFSFCDSVDQNSRVAGTWSYSDSQCDGDDTTVQGSTLEIDFEVGGDGTRTFETNSCLITNKFKWVMDGNNIVMASKSTTCEPADCDQALEVGGVDFLLSCSQNFDDVWKNSEFSLEGNIAVETFKVQNLECKNTFINPEIE
jgi:hypothetical protein